MKTYFKYHVHSDLSLKDSCSSFQEYVDRAVQDGDQALSFSEHGTNMNWVAKKKYCEAHGLRYIHSVEIYLTENLNKKVRDNYHTILIARNLAGVKELNSLITVSCQEDHFYYVNRLSFDEFLQISDNIITTSACLASPLRKLPESNPYYERLARKYTFFEVQPHNQAEQIEFNKKLYKLSSKYGVPLIAGTDTHSVNKYKAECRQILIEDKRGGQRYHDDDFDLTYKTYDELVEMFRAQQALSEPVYLEAIENTNRMLGMIEDFELDESFKYPILYGSREADSDMFTQTVERKFKEKVDKRIIPYSQQAAFRRAIDEEMDVFRTLRMDGFMLSMSEIISWCKEQGMAIGPSRGSVGGSRVAYVTDIIDINPETWHTNFYRFANPDRLEAGDIDIDCVESDRPAIFNHIIERFGRDKTARVAAFGTLASKAVIDCIGRVFRTRWEATHGKTSDEANPWSIAKVSSIKMEFEIDPEATKRKYPDLFYYYDGLLGTKVSQSVHPAGMVISSVTLDDNYGVFVKDGERCLVLDMDNAHDANLIKYDLLILKTVQVIRDTCNYVGVPYPKSHEVDWDDQKVWRSMITSPVGIFQMESPFAFESLKKFKPKSIFDITLVTACIRPSGASYRDKLLARIPNVNGSEQLNEILKDNLGYLVYQEDILRFLMEVCALSGGEADTVRRGVAKKKKEILDASMRKIVDGYCACSIKPKEDAECEVKEIIQVIEDASDYMFGYNHACGYSLLSYLCAYYRYYYPLEFLTAFLNNAANDDDIKNGTAYATRIGIKITMPKWGLSTGNYLFNRDRNIITKGLASVKYIGEKCAQELYTLSKSKQYAHFMELLKDIDDKTSTDSRQLDVLIKIDFFSDFGNQRELVQLIDLFELFKKGDAKRIRKEVVDGTPLEPVVKRYAIGTTKSGGVAKSYALLDVMAILIDLEEAVMDMHMDDLSDIIKVRNFADIMGYVGYVSGKNKDRPKLYINGVYPLYRKKDNIQFGYSVVTKSIGSGVESRFTVPNEVFNKDPIQVGDIICCHSYAKNGPYFRMTAYEKIYC